MAKRKHKSKNRVRKIILTLVSILIALCAGGFFYIKHQQNNIPPPEIIYFNDSINQQLFYQGFAKWNSIGFRKNYEACVQPTSIKATSDNGKTVLFPKNTKVGFRSCIEENGKFKYVFMFNEKIYDYYSEYPFDLLYDIHSDEVKPDWKNLWGLLGEKNSRISFQNCYEEIANALLNDLSYEDRAFSWLRELDSRFEAHLGGQLITIKRLKYHKITPKKTFKLRYKIEESDVTPVMEEYWDKYVRRKLLYVHNVHGVWYSKTKEKIRTIEPYFDATGLKKSADTPFLFLGFTYKNGEKYIIANFQQKDTALIEVGFFDDVLPLKPEKTNYEAIVEKICKKDNLNCDDIVLSFSYLFRQLHYNLKTNPDSPQRFKTLVAKLSSKSKNCKVKQVGPHNKIKITKNENSKYIPDKLLPNIHKGKHYLLLPDPIVRCYYNNMDFLIPAWSNYNAKPTRRRKTGVKRDLSSKNNYTILKGKYTLEIPPINELLSEADLSKILIGYGFERITFNNATILETSNYRNNLEKEEKNNAIVFKTRDSYFDIAKKAYENEKFKEGEIDIIAKGLREFNYLLSKKNRLHWVAGDTIQVYSPSITPQTVVVPVEIEQLGLERRPVTTKFEYIFKLNE